MPRRFVLTDLQQEEDQTTTEAMCAFRSNRRTNPHEHQIKEWEEHQAAVDLTAIADENSRGGQT